jgi:hypothetical protein
MKSPLAKFYRVLLTATASVVVSGLTGQAEADLVVSVQPTAIPATAGNTGAFDVLVTNTGLSSIDVLGYRVTLDLPTVGSLLASFTGAVTSDSPPLVQYLFTDPAGIQAGLISAQQLEYTDNQASGFQTIAAGQTYGLGHVSFSVPSGTPALTEYPVSFETSLDSDFIPRTSFLLSDASTYVTPTPVGGTIVVQPAAVPEPSSLLLLLGAGGVGLAVRLRSTKTAVAV